MEWVKTVTFVQNSYCISSITILNRERFISTIHNFQRIKLSTNAKVMLTTTSLVVSNISDQGLFTQLSRKMQQSRPFAFCFYTKIIRSDENSFETTKWQCVPLSVVCQTCAVTYRKEEAFFNFLILFGCFGFLRQLWCRRLTLYCPKYL